MTKRITVGRRHGATLWEIIVDISESREAHKVFRNEIRHPPFGKDRRWAEVAFFVDPEFYKKFSDTTGDVESSSSQSSSESSSTVAEETSASSVSSSSSTVAGDSTTSASSSNSSVVSSSSSSSSTNSSSSSTDDEGQ